mgnify:CR=1 FL=1
MHHRWRRPSARLMHSGRWLQAVMLYPVHEAPSGISHSAMRTFRPGPPVPERLDRQIRFPFKYRQSEPTAMSFPTRLM